MIWLFFVNHRKANVVSIRFSVSIEIGTLYINFKQLNVLTIVNNAYAFVNTLRGIIIVLVQQWLFIPTSRYIPARIIIKLFDCYTRFIIL